MNHCARFEGAVNSRPMSHRDNGLIVLLRPGNSGSVLGRTRRGCAGISTGPDPIGHVHTLGERQIILMLASSATLFFLWILFLTAIAPPTPEQIQIQCTTAASTSLMMAMEILSPVPPPRSRACLIRLRAASRASLSAMICANSSLLK